MFKYKALVAVVKEDHTWEDLSIEFSSNEVILSRLFKLARKCGIIELHNSQTPFLDVCVLEVVRV